MKRAKTLSSIGVMQENTDYQLRGACRIRMGADGVITCTSYSTDVAWFDSATCRLRFHPDCYNMSSTTTRHVGEFKAWLNTRLCHGLTPDMYENDPNPHERGRWDYAHDYLFKDDYRRACRGERPVALYF